MPQYYVPLPFNRQWQNGNLQCTRRKRISRLLDESQIKATDTYAVPPQIIWVNDLKLVVRRDKMYYYDMTPAEAGLFDGSD